MTEIIKGECSVELIRENEDGSADYAFNFPPEALHALTRLGILTAIQAGIEDAKRLNPEEYDDPYKDLMDAHAKELDRAMELLRRAEVEMRYAGWTKYESDNSARNGVYEQIVRFLK